MIRARAALVLALLILRVSASANDEALPLSAQPHLAPWIVVGPSDPRIALIQKARPALLSPNAPGLLLDVRAGTFQAAGLAATVRELTKGCASAGFRSGLVVELPNVPVPTDARGAEVATADTLYPGLGALLEAADKADLVALLFPDLTGDLAARRFVLKKIAAEIRALNPTVQIALVLDQEESGRLFPAATPRFKTEETAAFADILGLRARRTPPSPEALRAEADEIAFGRPLMVIVPPVETAVTLLDLAARYAAAGAPFSAAPLHSAAVEDGILVRSGIALRGDYGPDTRPTTAATRDGLPLSVYRYVSGLDLGGLVLVTGIKEGGEPYRGPVTVTLDAPSYASAEVTELMTGRTGRFDIPKSSGPPKLSVSTQNGPVVIRLTAREKTPAEAAKARIGVSAERLATAEEILARHQVWRAARDARWNRFSAINQTAIRFKFPELNNTFELTFRGPFFFEPGKGYDWAWTEAYFNGVKWRGKKFPELPLLQPEKVSDLPLEITFNDAYQYALRDEETVNGIRCFVLDFSPRERAAGDAVYEGRVFISKNDYSAIRVVTRQLNLKGEVQSVDEVSDFEIVDDRGDGIALRFPVRTKGQWILKTFSRTTVLERETVLENVRLDPEDYEAEKAAAAASKAVMVRDTERGVRYLEKDKEGNRVVVEDPKTAKLFGLAGLFYDSSYDFPLPLVGLYYLDLDFRKRKEQMQVFFGGVLLAGSYNDPALFGSKIDLGVDIFGIAIQGSDTVYRNGEKVDSEEVKQRPAAGNLNFGFPIGRHLKFTATAGISYRDFAAGDDMAPGFAVPSDHTVTRLEGRLIWDLSGFSISARYGWNHRSKWEPWGYPGNPDYDPGKDDFQTYALQLSKDFHFSGFRRLRTSVSYLGTENADRFSKITFGSFGGNSLRGFSSGSLRAEKAGIVRVAYGLVFGQALRLEGLYEHAFVKDEPANLDWASFGGAGISGQFSGPWSTIVQLDAGLPVVGRDRGQKGLVLNLTFLKPF